MTPVPIGEFLRELNPDADAPGFAPFGIEVRYPCPFCAYPDLIVAKAPDMRVALEAGDTCPTCARTTAAVVVRGVFDTTIEMVQTGGDDPPDGVDIRRVY